MVQNWSRDGWFARLLGVLKMPKNLATPKKRGKIKETPFLNSFKVSDSESEVRILKFWFSSYQNWWLCMSATVARVTDAQWDSDNLSAGNGSYWEANLGDQSGDGGKKRKWTDDEDTPPQKVSRLETVYKLGPRNGPSGKIKKSVAFSMGVQDLVQQDLKPVSFGNAFSKQGSNKVAPQAGWSKASTPFIDIVTSVNSVPVKPKPRPRPVKGKVSTELGIVTWDRSKKIAEESVRTTQSKKHLV